MNPMPRVCGSSVAAMHDMFHRPARKGPSQEKSSILLAQGWRSIEGFERYLVSREGQIFSTIRAGRFLRQTESNVGYLYVSLMAEGASEPVKVLVHRIVAKAFCDGDGEVVNHLDGNKKNNRAENLEWCSYADNNDHARDAGLVRNFGSKHYAAKLSADDVLAIRARAARGEMHRLIAADYGLIRQTVQQIASGKRWKRVR